MNKKSIRDTACALLASLVLAGCSSTDDIHDHGHDHGEHMDHGTGGPTEIVPTLMVLPYGPGWGDYEGKPAEDVAIKALEVIVTQDPWTGPQGTLDKLNGAMTTNGWHLVSSQPERITAAPIGPILNQWADAGGGVKAEVTIDPETHPVDTQTSWARKITTKRHLEGVDAVVVDQWALALTRTHPSDNWLVDQISHIETTYE